MREIKFRVLVSENSEKPYEKTCYYVETLKPNYKCQGYIMRKVKGHLYANKRGYVPEHRLLIEQKLERFLIPRIELVHHINGIRDDNRLVNLKITSPTKGHVGKRNKNGQFVTLEPIFQEIKIRLLNTNTKEVRPYTLSELIGKTFRRGQFKFMGRFTGLKDKNGKEIYEDDIVQRDNSYPPYDKKLLKIEYGLLDCAGFGMRGINVYNMDHSDYSQDSLTKQWAENIEVIGNIYENY